MKAVKRPKRSSAPLIVDRTLKDRDLAGHFSSQIREEKHRERRKAWWSWYGQRRHDLDAIFKSRYGADGSPLPNAQQMEAMARAMAFHLQAYEGPEGLRCNLEAWLDAIVPFCVRAVGGEPDLDEIAAAVSHRRRDIGAIHAGQLLQVTWEERCRLRLRTIRPHDLIGDDFVAAVRQRKRDLDKERARRTRRRQRKRERADYRWQGDCEPWLHLGVSRPTWYRHKKAGTLCSLVSACSIAVPEWLVSGCQKHDLRIIKERLERETSASRLGVASESADALVSPAYRVDAEGEASRIEEPSAPASTIPRPLSTNASPVRSVKGSAPGEASGLGALHTRCLMRVANNRDQKEQAA